MCFFSVPLLSVLRGHCFFPSPPQRPMTSDFKGVSIQEHIHYNYFPILILESRTASYQRRYKMVPVVHLFSTEHSKGKILALSQEIRKENNAMDKIWYRNLSKSEVFGRCDGDEKTNNQAEPTNIER